MRGFEGKATPPQLGEALPEQDGQDQGGHRRARSQLSELAGDIQGWPRARREAIPGKDGRAPRGVEGSRKGGDGRSSMDDGRESAQGLPVYVQQELADLRGQMRQFMSYAQMMEKKNAALTDQVTMLVTTLQSREQQISSDFSPQHPVPRSGNGNTLWAPSKEEGVASVEKRERSRSPTRKIAKLEHKLDPVEFKLQLEKISEGSGGGAAPDPEADAKKGLNVPHPLPEAGSSALAPFGKKTKPGAAERQNVSPYGRVRTKEMDGSCVLEGLDS